MPKLSLTIIAVSLLFVISSCKKLHVEPDKGNHTDTTQAGSKEWLQLNNYPGSARRWTGGFFAGNIGYVIGGEYEESVVNDTAKVFQYDPSADKWHRLNDYPGEGMGMMAGFSINSKTYLGTGFNYSTNLLCSD